MARLLAEDPMLQPRLREIFDLTRKTPLPSEEIRQKILHLISWYRPSGNPITEQHMTWVFTGYKRTWRIWTGAQHKQMERFCYAIADAQIRTYNEGFRIVNNFQSYRIYIVSDVGNLWKNEKYLSWAYKMWLKQIETNLRPNGSSLDFEERDSLGYHTYNLRALLASMKMLEPFYPTFNFYEYEAPTKTSLKKSIRFLIPYITGAQTNLMLVKSKFASDKASPNHGKVWDKKDAMTLIRDASPYDAYVYLIYYRYYGVQAPLDYRAWLLVGISILLARRFIK
jgi:hypothetical protein